MVLVTSSRTGWRRFRRRTGLIYDYRRPNRGRADQPGIRDYDGGTEYWRIAIQFKHWFQQSISGLEFRNGDYLQRRTWEHRRHLYRRERDTDRMGIRNGGSNDVLCVICPSSGIHFSTPESAGPNHTIVGPDPVDHGSIDTGSHNPFLDQTATFTIGDPSIATKALTQRPRTA